MRWQDKLTKSDLQHLREGGMTTLAAFLRNRKWQLREKSRQIKHGYHNTDACPQCVVIARKLGVR